MGSIPSGALALLRGTHSLLPVSLSLVNSTAVGKKTPTKKKQKKTFFVF